MIMSISKAMETPPIEALLKDVAGRIALGVEMIAALLIAYGAIEAVIGLFRKDPRPDPRRPLTARRMIFLRFGIWLLLGLEFELAADIVRSAIAPTWDQIGQLGVIAVIRTFLNYFLEKDVEKYAEVLNETEDAPKAEA
jgi:uncharacterized membrane protein